MPTDIDKYLNLLPSANDDKPDFIDTITAVLQPFVDGQNVVESLIAKYDLDTAEGMQLDVVGQWVGFGRNVLAPLVGVYFAFDEEGVGFDQGVWFTSGDPTEGLVSLDDPTYRIMLKAKISSNYWDGSLAQLQQIFADFFAVSPGTYAFVIDNFDMTMTIGISGVIPGIIFQSLFLRTQIPLPPAAVQSNVLITTEDGAPIFGFDMDNEYIGGFDHGAWSVQVV